MQGQLGAWGSKGRVLADGSAARWSHGVAETSGLVLLAMIRLLDREGLHV